MPCGTQHSASGQHLVDGALVDVFRELAIQNGLEVHDGQFRVQHLGFAGSKQRGFRFK